MDSGRRLMEQPVGWTVITDSTPQEYDDQFIFIALHGYGSRGYEWVHTLKSMHNRGFRTYVYRYDWTQCPDSVARAFVHGYQILQSSWRSQRMVIFSHSYGGLVARLFADDLEVSVPVEVHIIASPLAGYDRITAACDYFESGNPESWYSDPAPNVQIMQWRTQHRQDGAFRDLTTDPQIVDDTSMVVYRLPAMMDGHRLGHNWSVSWVTDEYLQNWSRP